MDMMVPIALWGWPIVVMGMFSSLKPRHAVLAAFLGGWLFLPMAAYSFEGLPDYGKIGATSLGALLGAVLFDSRNLLQFRLRWVDLPMVIWCLAPMASSLSNGLGAYDGASATFGQVLAWGVPYLFGRIYFTDLTSLRDLAIGIFIGGLVYVPLCLIEVRLSPRLHIWVYGFHQHHWSQTHRFGGWRPTVFMQHGLMVAMWMVVTTLVGYWLWRTRSLVTIWLIPPSLLVLIAGTTAILCKSAGAIILGVCGCVVLPATRLMRTKLALAALIVAPICYMGLRVPSVLTTGIVVRAAESIPVITDSHVGSLQYRVEAEDILVEHAMRRPVFGWAGWNRNRPAKSGADVKDVVTDGLWVLTLGRRGVVGLAALTLVILLPAALFLYRYPVDSWWDPRTSAVAVLSLVLILFMIDSLFNAMFNPVYMLASGGIAGFMARPYRAYASDLARRSTSRSGVLNAVGMARNAPRYGSGVPVVRRP